MGRPEYNPTIIKSHHDLVALESKSYAKKNKYGILIDPTTSSSLSFTTIIEIAEEYIMVTKRSHFHSFNISDSQINEGIDLRNASCLDEFEAQNITTNYLRLSGIIQKVEIENSRIRVLDLSDTLPHHLSLSRTKVDFVFFPRAESFLIRTLWNFNYLNMQGFDAGCGLPMKEPLDIPRYAPGITIEKAQLPSDLLDYIRDCNVAFGRTKDGTQRLRFMKPKKFIPEYKSVIKF